MAKLIKFTFGYLDTVCDSEGSPYPDDNFRSAYYSIPGLIALYRSERLAPGKQFITFFPYESGSTQRYLKTSVGNLEEQNTNVRMITAHSSYSFHADPDCLTDLEKKVLCLNTINGP